MNLVHTLNDVFVTRPIVIRRTAAPEHLDSVTDVSREPEAGTAQGVFVDPKTLASFPVAAAVVTTLSRIVVATTDGKMIWIALIVSLVIGGLIVAITMSEPGARPKNKLEWFITLGIAVINSLLLYAAVVGIDQIAGPGTPKS